MRCVCGRGGCPAGVAFDDGGGWKGDHTTPGHTKRRQGGCAAVAAVRQRLLLRPSLLPSSSPSVLLPVWLVLRAGSQSGEMTGTGFGGLPQIVEEPGTGGEGEEEAFSGDVGGGAGLSTPGWAPALLGEGGEGAAAAAAGAAAGAAQAWGGKAGGAGYQDLLREEARLGQEAAPELIQEFKARCRTIQEEFFSSENTREVLLDLRALVMSIETRHFTAQLGGGKEGVAGRLPFDQRGVTACILRAMFVRRLVQFAVDRADRQKELCAQLLSHLHGEVLSEDEVAAGFQMLLDAIEDMSLDVPKFPRELGFYLARAKIDGMLPHGFPRLDPLNAVHPESKLRACLDHYKGLVFSGAEGRSRALVAWGGARGDKGSVEWANEAVRKMLDEYAWSHDQVEFGRRLSKLGMPHFHHEVVRLALRQVVTVRDKSGGLTLDVHVMELLEGLNSTGEMSETQIAKGFSRFAAEISDVALDVPDARDHFSHLAAEARFRGILPLSLSSWSMLRSMPAADAREDNKSKRDAIKRGRIRLGSVQNLRSASIAGAIAAGGQPGGWNRFRKHLALGLRSSEVKAGVHAPLDAAATPSPSKGSGGMGGGPRKLNAFDASFLVGGKAAREGAAEEEEDNDSEVTPEPKFQRFMSVPNLAFAEAELAQSIKPLGKVHNYRCFSEFYRMGKVLGSGGFAVVRKCTHLAENKEYAVKIMHVDGADHGAQSEVTSSFAVSEDADVPESLSREEIENELSLMQQLNHPNIIHIKEYFVEKSKFYLVMDLMEGPEIQDALSSLGEGHYTENDVRLIMRGLFESMAYMHGRGIAHRDLKLENLVLRRPGDLSSVCIVDFGLAKQVRMRERMTESCGTPWYSSPELILGRSYTGSGVDCWALGVSMYALLCGEWPFDTRSEDGSDDEDQEDAMCLRIADGLVDIDGQPVLRDFVSAEAKDLLRGLLARKPKDRLSAAEALEHKWFTGAAGHTANALHKAHRNLDALIAKAGGSGGAGGGPRKATRTFEAGDLLVGPHGSIGGHVYLIREGLCEVLVPREQAGSFGGELPAEDEVAEFHARLPAPTGFVLVGLRREGNFVGELTGVLGADGDDDNDGAGDADGRRAIFSTDGASTRAPRALVRAITKVTAVELDQGDMAWAVKHDEVVEHKKKQASAPKENAPAPAP